MASTKCSTVSPLDVVLWIGLYAVTASQGRNRRIYMEDPYDLPRARMGFTIALVIAAGLAAILILGLVP